MRALEVHERLPVIGQGPQLCVLRVAQIALGLHHEKVGGQTDFETALFRLEALLRQLTGGRGGVDTFQVALYRERGIRYFSGNVDLKRTQPGQRLGPL